MSTYGIMNGIGAMNTGLRSYYDVRGIRRRQEEYDKTAEETERLRKMQAEIDALTHPEKQREIQHRSSLRAEERPLEFNQMRRQENAAVRGEEVAVAGHEPQLNRIGRTEEQEAAMHEPFLASVRRGEEVAQRGHIPQLNEIDRTEARREAAQEPFLNRINRTEEQESARHPGQMQDIANEDALRALNQEWASLQVNSDVYDETQYQENQLANQEVMRAFRAYQATGQVKYLETIYNEFINDGQDAQIEEVGPDQYVIHHSNGNSSPTPVSGQQLFEGTVNMWDEYMNSFVQGPFPNRAASAERNRNRYAAGGGRYGGALTARGSDVDNLAQAMLASGQFPNVSPEQIRLMAWQEILKRGGYSNQSDLREAYNDIAKILIQQKDIMGQPNMTPQEALDQAIQYVDGVMAQSGGVVQGQGETGRQPQPTAPAPAAGGGQVPLQDIPQPYVDALLQFGSPKAVKAFNDRFNGGQPGYAEEILERHRNDQTK